MKIKPSFTWLAIMVGLCAVGLLFAQIKWFQDGLKLKETQFQDKVLLLMCDTDKSLRGNREFLKYLNRDLKGTKVFSRDERAFNNSPLSGVIYNTLDSIFTQNRIETTFHFGIYKNIDCQPGKLVLSNQQGYLMPAQGSPEMPFSCLFQWESEPFLMALKFPEKDKYLLKQTGGLLGITLFLFLFLFGIFAYTLWFAHRQKKLSEIKNDLVNNLTHEFKTPLASISLASKVLQKNTNLIFPKKELIYLQLISKESKRLENSIDKILQLAALDAGNFELDKTKVNLHQLVEKVVDSCELLLKEKNGRISLNLNAKNPVIMADANQCFNMFYNLLDNAIKYSHNQPEIYLETMDLPEGFCFNIRDKGIGMEDQVQKNVFEKFYRASSGNVHNVKGFGLGLSYVRSIVKAHKGKIRFNSVVNKGTEFTVLLPASK